MSTLVKAIGLGLVGIKWPLWEPHGVRLIVKSRYWGSFVSRLGRCLVLQVSIAGLGVTRSQLFH